jgi:chemotaxis protein methyltransferase WspC
MALADFENLLRASIGLDVHSIGSSAIEQAVRVRQSAFNLDDRDAYWQRVNGCRTELQALIEAVVVPETWFFRDREAFVALARIGHEQWLRAPADRVLRLLSLPSSTGEEPYSMAMALLDAGVPADRFRIDAVDVSAQALAQAERAVYGRNAFRSDELTFRDRHFEATPLGHRLNDSVRRQVHFQQGNVFADDFLPGLDIYDVIFCRNLLIYFDRPTQDRAVGILGRLLKPSGTVFVAPSETGLLLNHDFVSAKVPLAFAFRKRATRSGDAKTTGAPPVSRRSTRRPVAPPASAHQSAESKSSSVESGFSRTVGEEKKTEKRPAAAPQPLTPTDQRAGVHADLDEAARLADQGSFIEAATRCEEHLRQHGPSANAFYLLGLVRDAAGNTTDAATQYRKALYLDPEHLETLMHLALLLEQQGNGAGAKVLRARALRLEQNGGL